MEMTVSYLGTEIRATATINVRYFTRYIHATKCRLQYFWYVTHHEMSAINECQVLPRNVRYIFYSRYTQNCQVLKCLIHDLKQVWLE